MDGSNWFGRPVIKCVRYRQLSNRIEKTESLSPALPYLHKAVGLSHLNTQSRTANVATFLKCKVPELARIEVDFGRKGANIVDASRDTVNALSSRRLRRGEPKNERDHHKLHGWIQSFVVGGKKL
jgi:hypothetical protein